jgi:hypothetical protein
MYPVFILCSKFILQFRHYGTIIVGCSKCSGPVSYIDIYFGLVSSKLLSKTTALREIIVLDLYAFTSVVAKQSITIYQSIAYLLI